MKRIFDWSTPLNHTLHGKFADPHGLITRKQQRQVSKVLLDGLYDSDSPISKLLGVRTEVMGEIIWQMLVEDWQIFPETWKDAQNPPETAKNANTQIVQKLQLTPDYPPWYFLTPKDCGWAEFKDGLQLCAYMATAVLLSASRSYQDMWQQSDLDKQFLKYLY